ncbi:MFS transporter [Thermoplasma sp. Kam2015]|nr:MFS transporter [Thermoplasma sp. Kam2015]
MYNHTLDKRMKLNFQLTIANASLSRFGLSAYNLVIIWVVLRITEKPVLAGLADSMMTFPLMLSIIVGAAVDRMWIKKELAITAALVRMMLLLLIIYSLHWGHSIYVILAIYTSTFLIGFTSDVIDSVRASWMKVFLREDQYKSGSSQLSSSTMLAQGIGFVLSGIIISLGDFRSFLCLALIFAVALFPLLGVKHSRYGGSGSIQEYIAGGVRLIIGDGRIREIILMGLIGNFLIGMAAIMFISLIEIGFGLSAVYVSMIFGVLVFGIAVGSFFASKISGKLGMISFSIYSVIGISFFSVSLVHSILLTIPPVLIAGLAMGIESVTVSTSLMRIIPSDMMARIQGAFNTFGIAATAVSSIVGGLLYQFAGKIHSFMVVGMAMILLALLIPFLRNFSKMVF